MFLTRIPLNRTRRGAQKLLGSPQAMHAAVLAGFPPTSGPERILWRVDTDGPAVSLLVLSPRRPDFTGLVEQAGWPQSDEEDWTTRDYQPLLHRLQVGGLWRFRLRANPVRASRELGKRVAHVTPAQQQQWLLERAESNGFEIHVGGGVPSVVVSDRQLRKFRRENRTVTLSTAQFDGLLIVRDLDRFRNALVAGIGRAKGYGCGLLTLSTP